MNRFIIIFILLFIIGISGCKKESEEIPSGTYLKKIIYHENVDQINHFYYNNSGLLSSREYEFNGIISERINYQYANGLINRIDYFELYNNTDLTLYLKYYLTYEYELNNIKKSTFYPEKIITTYEYSNNRISKKNGSSKYTTFEHDNSGNIIKSVLYMEGEEYWKFIYEFDDKKNPLYKVDPVHGSIGEVDYIVYTCPNNLVKETFINENADTISISEYIYTYNNKDFPVESYELFTSKSNGYERDSINHKFFEYEIK
jgi:hypothetical protein